MEDGNTVAHICFFGVLLSYCSDNTGIPDHVSGKGGSKAPCVGEEVKMDGD